MRLPDRCHEKAGRPMTFEVERAGADGGPKVQTLTATPDDSPPWDKPWGTRDLDIPGLGLCVPISTKVVAVKPGSPADRAGIKPGDVINSMTIKPPKDAKGSGRTSDSDDQAETVKFDDGSVGWPAAFWALQTPARAGYRAGGEQGVAADPRPARTRPELVLPLPGAGVPAAPAQDAPAADRARPSGWDTRTRSRTS